MQFSKSQLIYTYIENKHLTTSLNLRNTSPTILQFKFKISTANKFMVKPSIGTLQPGQSIDIQVCIHRDIVKNYLNEKVQVLYGRGNEDGKWNSYLLTIRVDGVESDLDLTAMVQSKCERVKSLAGQISNMKLDQIKNSNSHKKKKSKFGLKLMLVIIFGLLIGYFGPLKIFKKKTYRN